NPKFLKRHGYDQLDDISQLFPQTDRNAWEKIGLIHSDLHNTIEDDGQEPETPTSVKHSGNRLSCKNLTAKNCIVYSINEANKTENKMMTLDTVYTKRRNAGKHLSE